ncbi:MULTISPECIES: helix-turn-helix domain-containing protein [unclassified Tenacibaculum]|uniref:helix-turn-helix domain-containing protein n=1 Tax=unclassified Tenacibaculum TaxID=2635139 RepID=UPI001F15A54E|nr:MULTISPECIES: helix-turn-helix domain-containing protein [unclassified Tenacibaculum]MCF2875236.1 helix-turn-helix domain-containing protein [Tenacibaculum sp. Cn5-1]MCF2935312.1 helix-turn-helix domain-containing protein [Tenacibaculum sp. Cn5-34]MCG7511246.1 helix-turn-helix domain-containing protein [Tenacibaculum sp. Cn5-46]
MIRTINNIAELYDFIGLKRIPCHEHFDILTHQDTYPDVHKMVSAHRRNFCSIIYLENQQDGEMHINQDVHSNLKDVLFFQSSQHIFSFVRGNEMKGFILFFKPEFLLPQIKDVVDEYSFFNSFQNNIYHLDSNEKEEIEELFKMIKKEKENQELSKYLLLALLEKSKLIQQKHQAIEKTISSEIQLVNSFKRLVRNHFIQEKSVSFYAQKLNLTANYLNDRIKKYTGKTAKEHITNRILLEAKNMLLYTDMDVAEISFILQFNEPSYFGKFFKKHTQTTPKLFRVNQ